MGAGFNIANLIAQSGGDGLDPEQAMRLRGLKSADAANAARAVGAMGTSPLALNPVFSSEPQGFSLAGNPSPTAASTGQALLSSPADPAGPAARQRKRLADMQSFQRYQELEGKWKKTPWFMPAQVKDRLEGQMDRTLRVAALEMADEGDVQRDSQAYADFLRDDLKTKATAERYNNELDLSRQQLEEGRKRWEAQAKEDAERIRIANEELQLRRSELGERRAERVGARAERAAERAAIQEDRESQRREPWEEAFEKALPDLMKPNAAGEVPTDADLRAARERYRALLGGAPAPSSGAPPMVSAHDAGGGILKAPPPPTPPPAARPPAVDTRTGRPAAFPQQRAPLTGEQLEGLLGAFGGRGGGAPREAVDPTTGKRFLVYPDGRTEPVR